MSFIETCHSWQPYYYFAYIHVFSSLSEIVMCSVILIFNVKKVLWLPVFFPLWGRPTGPNGSLVG